MLNFQNVGVVATTTKVHKVPPMHITAHVKFGDDCANAQPGLSQWTAAFRVVY